jgi:hypothetical protein
MSGQRTIVVDDTFVMGTKNIGIHLMIRSFIGNGHRFRGHRALQVHYKGRIIDHFFGAKAGFDRVHRVSL